MADSIMPAQIDLPIQVVVDENGAYWRDYGDHYSMCPVSDDNDPVRPVALFVLEAALKGQMARIKDEYQRFYDFVAKADPAIVDAWHFTENVRVQHG